MAKKSRSISTSSTSTVKSAPTFAGIQRGAANVEFNPDYSTIKQELKRVGILAGIFFAFLIALSFVLPMFVK
jgi:hypothetical protein